MEDQKLVSQTGETFSLRCGVHVDGSINKNNGFDLRPCCKNNGFDLRPCCKNSGLDGMCLHPFDKNNIFDPQSLDKTQGSKTEENNGFDGLRPCGKSGKNNGLDAHPCGETKENFENRCTLGKRLHADVQFCGKRLRVPSPLDGKILQASVDIHPFDKTAESKTEENNGFDGMGLRTCGKTGKNNGSDAHPYGEMEENVKNRCTLGKRLHNDVSFCGKRLGVPSPFNRKILGASWFNLDPFDKIKGNNGFDGLRPCGKTGKNNGLDAHAYDETEENIEQKCTLGERLHADASFCCKISPFDGKILQGCSRKHLKRNRINELSEDVLLCVLAFLTMKEVGRTSVLSKRWRNLWSHMPRLDFDGCNVSHKISLPEKEVEVARYWYKKSLESYKNTYIHWVDQVVGSHNHTVTVDEFMVKCDLQEDTGRCIDEWVRFAMQKGVKRLGIDVLPIHHKLQYTFPCSSFSNSLISLELSGIDVNGEILQTFLYNCPTLEYLSVKKSRTLAYLNVVGPSLNLKYLIVYHCMRIKLMEIAVPNIVYVNYCGPTISMSFTNTPKLNELYVGGQYAMHLSNNIMRHSSSLSQLESLTLVLTSYDYSMRSVESPEFPEWTRLKKLVVETFTWRSTDLCRIIIFIKACPCLNTFVLQLEDDDLDIKILLQHRRWWRDLDSHHHLKIVQISGSSGYTGFDVAFYLLDISVSLEKIIIGPHQLRNRQVFYSCKSRREKAKQLCEFLKPGTDLLIL